MTTSGDGVSARPTSAVLKTKSRADAVWIAARAPASAAKGSYTARGSTADPKPIRQRTVGLSSRLGDPDAVTVSPYTTRRPAGGTPPATSPATPHACARVMTSADA